MRFSGADGAVSCRKVFPGRSFRKVFPGRGIGSFCRRGGISPFPGGGIGIPPDLPGGALPVGGGGFPQRAFPGSLASASGKPVAVPDFSGFFCGFGMASFCLLPAGGLIGGKSPLLCRQKEGEKEKGEE
jgi:hypothetical protein